MSDTNTQFRPWTTAEDLTRVKDDKHGNRRYAVHYTELLNGDDGGIGDMFLIALNKASEFDGTAYQDAACIVFTTNNVDALLTFCNQCNGSIPSVRQVKGANNEQR